VKANYDKQDFWALKAKKEGYPARSVYKLEEIDKKFSLLNNMRGSKLNVLDLGAAPGSWSLWLLRRIKNGDFLCACDLKPLSHEFDRGLFDDKNKFFFIHGDFTLEENRTLIASFAPYSLIISDAAPATSGNRSIDTDRSLDLAETVFHFAETLLADGGSLVIKIFQGGRTDDFLKKIRPLFNSVKTFKPRSCRANSFETYIIARRHIRSYDKYKRLLV
jgi:23S rRNA (uridine2552-2'-O)-methyltransferase